MHTLDYTPKICVILTVILVVWIAASRGLVSYGIYTLIHMLARNLQGTHSYRKFPVSYHNHEE